MMEALVIVTLTALIALMILPLAQQSSRDAVSISNREINISAAERGELAFRELLASASQPRVTLNAQPTMIGNAAGLIVNISSEGRSTCVDAGEEGPVRLTIMRRGQGGALVCSRNGQQATLFTWDQGEAALAYGEGGAWSTGAVVTADAAMHRAVLVRFSLQAAGLPRLNWITQAGWTQPAQVAPDAGAGEQAQQPQATQ